jgi:hypothetical protein
MERYTLRKSNKVEEDKGQYHVEISNGFAPLENLSAEVDNVRISASLANYKFTKLNPWLDKGCTKLLDERKRAKLQGL